MKKFFVLFGLTATLAWGAPELPTEITLTNGFVMRECTIVRWDQETITVKYVGGTVPVRYENIDPVDRLTIEAYKEEGVKLQLAADRKEAKSEAVADHKQAEREAHVAKKQAEIDRKAAAIQEGLDQHLVVAGMTTAQVRSMFGPPARSSSLTNVDASEWWIYDGRGKDARGVPCNLMIHFKAGLVTRWNNTQH